MGVCSRGVVELYDLHFKLSPIVVYSLPRRNLQRCSPLSVTIVVSSFEKDRMSKSSRPMSFCELHDRVSESRFPALETVAAGAFISC